MHYEFTAFPRGVEGRGASRRLRRSGRAPAVVYGGTAQPQPIELDHNALMHALKNEAFHSSILTMKLGSESQQVLLRDVQMHPFRKQVLHVDFQRVDANRKIHMKVPLHFVNADQSPGVKEQGGVVNHVLNELDVVCLPDDLPEYIEVDLGGLAVGHSLHVRAVALPKGVELTLHKDEDPVMATVVVPALITEEEETAAADAVVSAADVPAIEQVAPVEGEAPAEGDKAGAKGAADRTAAKGAADKAAAKVADKAGDKADKKDKK
jgi:large subunit ribosomal protein L25